MTVVTDYSVVTPAWVAAAADELIVRAQSIVERIEAVPDDEITFDSTVGAIDELMDVMFTLRGGLGFLGYVHTDEGVRAAAHEVERRQSKFAIDVWARPLLWSKVAAYAATADASTLTGERAKLLADTLMRFREAGHELDAEAMEELGRRRKRAVELSSEYAANLGETTDHLDIPRAELTGLPDSWLDSLEPGAEPGTVRVTTAYPHVFPLLESATSRRWREAVMRMHLARAQDVNIPLVVEQIAERKRMAELFGEPSWAHHRLHSRMAATPERVAEFYADLTPRLTGPGVRERDAMQELLAADLAAGRTDGDPVVGDHDWRYYDSQQRQSLHGVDPWVVAEHFPLDAVLTGMLDLTGEMFGVRYEPVQAPVWHPDVRTLRIVDSDTGRHLATAHLDLFPREGKFTHAAAFEIVDGRLLPDGSYRPPVSSIVANFTAPTADAPSLLTHDEVVTLFHEWGHILHMSLTEATYVQHAGARTEWDLVEAPSQILEHWAWDPGVLGRFARHHRTGAPLPPELLDGMVASRQLNAALRTLRQVGFGVIDQGLHGPDQPADLEQLLDESDRVSLFPRRPGTNVIAQFGHLMEDYDAGFYGYLWSEVYGDDMYSVFVEEGVTDPVVGRRYREAILARGGSADGLTLLRGFLGRDPRQDAFLANKGLLPT